LPSISIYVSDAFIHIIKKAMEARAFSSRSEFFRAAIRNLVFPKERQLPDGMMLSGIEMQRGEIRK